MPHPTPLLEKLAPMLRQGKTALDIACGLGGNSLYLSELGFSVIAWDISDTAIHYLNELSGKHKLTIKAEVKDLDSYIEVNNSFDLVVDTFYLNRSLFPQIKKLVKPGGLFFMQTFFLTEVQSRSTISDQYKLKPSELKDIFANWETLHFEQDVHSGLQSILTRKKTDHP